MDWTSVKYRPDSLGGNWWEQAAAAAPPMPPLRPKRQGRTRKSTVEHKVNHSNGMFYPTYRHGPLDKWKPYSDGEGGMRRFYTSDEAGAFFEKRGIHTY